MRPMDDTCYADVVNSPGAETQYEFSTSLFQDVAIRVSPPWYPRESRSGQVPEAAAPGERSRISCRLETDRIVQTGPAVHRNPGNVHHGARNSIVTPGKWTPLTSIDIFRVAHRAIRNLAPLRNPVAGARTPRASWTSCSMP